MSAAEIIEQIKALPQSEVEIVREFLSKEQPATETTADFEEAASQVFAKHDRVLRELAK
jgi:hypothetical protein